MRYNASEYDPNAAGAIAPIPPGRYRFQIIEATEGYTKTTKVEMITLKLLCLEPDRERSWVYDALVSSNPYVSQRIGSIFASAGIAPQTVPPALAARYFLDLIVTAQIKQETYQGKSKAAVHYYIAAENLQAFNEGPGEYPEDNGDDIPF